VNHGTLHQKKIKKKKKYRVGVTEHLQDDKLAASSTGSPNLSTIDILSRMSLCWVLGEGAVLYIVGCVAASLASTR